jgi:hypothetical protein
MWRRLDTRFGSPSRHPKTDGLMLQRWFELERLMPQMEFVYNVTRALGIEHTPGEANFAFYFSRGAT